ncbi:Gfo/Idh/MocA family protein [Paenibacillus monticola]|uniref:Gfo/Idh/MocA family oxidoreductase n=1 Tax=Paenibacillus monticola TaxID=2666075 RepID=A0A7X2HBV9_9BACL|nr:Gfo/Idh/MocA family oxidoreductase [Paenibacillus monticola]MRN57274.1 gfo/Idh/MocA family oxidoreductase [Paenibacillus monticola]
MRPIHIGVIGCAQILERSLIDPMAQCEGYQIYGIASRSLSKAEQYAKNYGIPVAFNSYEALLHSSEIDMVYIVLSNDLHKEWAVQAVQANKHVLVEKPLCLSSTEFSEIEQANKKGKVHILEGLMVQHHPWQDKVKSIVDEKPYGRLHHIDSSICIVPKYDLTQNYRSVPDKGGGSFHDLGCYWLQFLQKIVGLEPVEYRASSAFDGPNGCDMTFEARLQYADGLYAALVTSFEQPYKSAHTLYFEQATVTINDFFRASLGRYKISVKIDLHTHAGSEKIYFEPQNYYTNQLSFFHDVITGKKQNLPLADSLERITWTEAIYQFAKERRNP